eukprot:c17008_g1_i1.p1 GENE.c17008_g1_i1~~c17008_g1_i1.p1  ORF type:complete len:704 (+),score=165.60 c17008_g1_i1:30-2141(+)
MSSSPLDACPYVDELITEYLAFRGFSLTLHMFQKEEREDKLEGFQVPKLMSTILGCANNLDIDALLGLWDYLDSRFFRELDAALTEIAGKLKTSLCRYFIVQALRKKEPRPEKVHYFFEKCGVELSQHTDWQPWFAITFTPNPHAHPHFAVYFSDEWFNAFSTSLSNFLRTAFSLIARPKILNFDAAKNEREALISENSRLNTKVLAMERQIAQLKSVYGQQNGSWLDPQGPIKNISTNQFRYSGSFAPQPPTTAPPFVVTRSHQNSLVPVPGETSSTVAATAVDKKLVPEISEAILDDGEQQQQQQQEQEQHRDENGQLPSNVLSEFEPKLEGEETPENLEEAVAYIGGLDSDDDPTSEVLFTAVDSIAPPRSNSMSGRRPSFLSMVNTRVFMGHSAAVTQCRWDNSGTNFASGGMDNSVRIWDLSQESRREMVQFESAEVSAMCWEHNDRFLVYGLKQQNVKVWSVADRKIVAAMQSDPACPIVTQVCCSPVAPSCVVCSSSLNMHFGHALAWNWSQNKVERVFDIDPIAVLTACTMNHNGTIMVAGGEDGMVRMFDLNQSSSIIGWKVHDCPIVSVQFVKNETCVLSVGADGKMVERGLHNYTILTHDFKFDSPSMPGWRSAVAFDSTMNRFAVTTTSGTASLFHILDKRQIGQAGNHHSAPVRCCDWHPFRDSVLTGGDDNTIQLTQLEARPQSSGEIF